MVIVSAEVELYLPMAASLKDKRRVIKSIIHKTRNKYNIAISEVGQNDLWKNSSIGLVTVSNKRELGEKVIKQALDFVEKNSDSNITRINIEHY